MKTITMIGLMFACSMAMANDDEDYYWYDSNDQYNEAIAAAASDSDAQAAAASDAAADSSSYSASNGTGYGGGGGAADANAFGGKSDANNQVGVTAAGGGSNVTLSDGGFSNKVRALALDLPGLAGAANSAGCHESNGGRGWLGGGTGGRTRINMQCMCMELGMSLVEVGQIGAGIAVLNSIEECADGNMAIPDPGVVVFDFSEQFEDFVTHEHLERVVEDIAAK